MGDQVRDLTLYVLNESAQQWAAWCHAGFCTTVSTNLSARVLMDKSIATDVRRILQAHSVPGGNAQLEITESAMNSDPARAIETIADLNTLGHHIARLTLDQRRNLAVPATEQRVAFHRSWRVIVIYAAVHKSPCHIKFDATHHLISASPQMGASADAYWVQLQCQIPRLMSINQSVTLVNAIGT